MRGKIKCSRCGGKNSFPFDEKRWVAALASPKLVILAGGFTPQNVKQVILYVKPAGVDVHSGVENKWGKKDSELVKLFIDEAVIGFQNIKN